MKSGTFSTTHIIDDLLIGILIALVSIPISMGYATVAGLPAVYGLYGSFLPILVYCLITSSPRFVFGVDAAPAALTGALLSSIGITTGTMGSSEKAAKIMPLITLFVAAWLLIFFVLRADRILKFISHPVMGGFITGIGITIICMQIPKLFGGSSGSGELPDLLYHIYRQGKEGIHLPSLFLGLGTIAVILTSRKLVPKLPMQAIVMVLGALSTLIFPIREWGIACLPSVKSGLPTPVLPDFSYLGTHYQTILISTFTIAVVILSETMLASNNLALKHEETLNPRREIIAYSLGNAAAAATGCCPVNGSVSRSGIADQFGVRSQWMSVSASVTMVLILLFGTGFISYLPVPVLTAIVISALLGTFEFRLAAKLRKVDRVEYIIFWSALVAVLLMGTIYGVIVGVLLSSVTFIVRQSRPKIELLGVDPEEEGYHSLKRKGNYAPIRDVVLYRFSGALFFANISDFEAGLTDAVQPDTRVIVVDSSGIGSVDVTAAERLLSLYRQYKKKGILFYLAGHVSEVNEELRSYGAEELINAGAVRSRISLALRDAGYDKPYILDTGQIRDKKSYDKQLAELTWAYGDEAQKKLREIAKAIAKELAEHPETDLEQLLSEEKEMAHGYWNYADEDEFLDYLEMQILLLDENEEPAADVQKLEDRIIERHMMLEEKIVTRNPSYVDRLKRRRKRRDNRFRKHHPESYDKLLEARQNYLKKLHEKNPELAALMEDTDPSDRHAD